MRLRELPFSFCYRIAIDLRIPTLVHRIIRYADQRRDVPDTLITSRLVTFKRMDFYVADKRMEQYQSCTVLYALKNCIAGCARHARPAVDARNQHHFIFRIAGKVLFDVAVDGSKVVAIASVFVTVIVADAPAIDVPTAIDRISGWVKIDPLHQLDH